MAELTVFHFMSANGFFKGKGDDVTWAHETPTDALATERLAKGGILLFGRTTYEQMVSFWPTPAAEKMAPAVAKGMNAAEKVVFSRSLETAEWQNTRVANDLAEEVKRMKAGAKDMTVLGSGSIVAQLADLGLVDAFELLVHPIALAEGTPILDGVKRPVKLKLAATRPFDSGTVLLTYRPR